MLFRIGMENKNEGYRSLAWALEHPGCFAYGIDADQALETLEPAIHEYAGWIGRREAAWLDPHDPELLVEETFQDYDINPDYEIVESGGYAVEPFFQYDWKPLTALDLERGLKLLAWSRQDLLDLLASLTPEQLAFKGQGERWDVAGILKHIGGAEWWYLDRLGLAFPKDQVPGEPLARLEKVRRALLEVVPTWQGLPLVTGKDGEIWSPRKVLRRAVWHERDHEHHIRKVLGLAP